MKLCFGTFTGVLFLCGAKPLTKNKLLTTIVQSADGSCELSASSVSWLMQCTTNLPDRRSNSRGTVITKVQEADPQVIAEYFARKVIPLIDQNKRKLAVLALRDIIMNDNSILNDTVVELVSGTTKKILHVQNRFKFANFLAGIFIYTVSVDNKQGKEAIEFINDDYLNSFIGMQNKISFPEPECVDETGIATEAFNTYLQNAEEKYGSVKTLLYKDNPKPFYSFYVPNDIEHPIGRSRGNTIKNVTAKSLTDISNFLILDGDGGLGKSMMMRHMLLNAVSNFSQYGYIPILIPLKDYGEAKTLFSFLYSTAKLLSKKITKTAFVDALTDGTVLLLFDGLDEIKSVHSKRFERELETFTDMYPKNRYILSSRPYQSLVSFSRFTALKLMPFTQEQSLKLVKRLEFRPDEPVVKERFCVLLQGPLYHTHRSFIENPLLLTIMIMTFEKFAGIPTKMHLFYRKAFTTMAEEHDATKGGFERANKSGLTTEIFTDYFAEFCFHTYKDYKLEFTEDEFSNYYNALITVNRIASPSAFAYDLCLNLCLMYMEGGKYYFMHRSFQEYFCALFFSKQKDIFLERLGDFFENRQMRGYSTFKMLYDMIPDKIETNIFIPFLEKLFNECENENGFWTFLEKIYPRIRYDKGEVNDYSQNTPISFLYNFLVELLNPRYKYLCDDLPGEKSLLVKEFGFVYEDEGCPSLTDIERIPDDYPWVQEVPEPVGWKYEFDIKLIRSRCGYEDILEMLNLDDFIFKSEYVALRGYLERIKEKQLNTDESLLALL